MPREALCPSCSNRLLVPADVADRTVTCPRCLASIGNPNVLVTASVPAPPIAQASSLCPGCARTVEAGWRVCPHCEEILNRPQPVSQPSSLERDVQRDTRAGCGVFGVLGAMLFLGIFIFFAMDGPRLLAGRPDAQGEVLFWGMVVVLFVSGSVFIAFKARSKATTIVFSVLGGLAFGAGMFFLVMVLVCMGIATTCHWGR